MTTKERFLKSEHVNKLFELSAEPWFQDTLEVALVKFSEQLLPQGEPYGDAANFNRLLGARRYIEILLELAVKPPEPQAPFKRTNLKHE